MRDADLHLDAKDSKVIKSKAPNLEGLLQTSGERGARMKTKHFLVMRKDTVALTSVWIQECVD